jgi:hypothetical protein
MVIETTKKEIIIRILADIGALVSVGLAVLFMFLRFRLYNSNYSWGTGIFIVVSLLLAMRRLKPPNVKSRSEISEPIMFQNVDSLAALEDRKAMESTEILYIRLALSIVFILFMPVDLILQIIKLVKCDVKENEEKK